MIGTALSHFTITAKLGEGGMGEVYRATDTKLGREVAIKVLPEAVAGDPERLARFEREAKVLASLNHPHIAAIYSIESAVPAGRPGGPGASQDEVDAALQELPDDPKAVDTTLGKPQDDLEAPARTEDRGDVLLEADDRRAKRQHPPAQRDGHPSRPVHFLVMELAEGEDLAARIARGPLPVDAAVAIARQIAEALEAAHERGIIHRDLKPQNIKLSGQGQVKVLDFGLAKALDPAAEERGHDGIVSPEMQSPLSLSPTLTAQMTGAGIILGTAAYMAPEQAKGQAVDKRADIWAFGVVLYEMLTGRMLFAGDSVPETLAGVLKTDIDFANLPPATPAPIARLLRRCLERDPANRLHDIADARLELDAAGDAAEEALSPAAATAASSGRRGLWLAATVLAALLGALAAWLLRPEPPRTSWKLHLAPPDEVGESRLAPHISPEGGSIAYLGANRLWVQDLGHFTPRQVPNGEGASAFCWSPDGRFLAFTVRTQLWRTLPGGDTKSVAELPEAIGSAGGVAWLADDTLVFSTGDSGLFKVPAAGGSPRSWLEPEPPHDVDFHTPIAVQDGRRVVFIVHRDSGGNALDLFDGETRRTLWEGSVIERAAWSPSGHLVFEQRGTTPGVWALPVDRETLEARGEAFLVMSGMGSPSVSREGTLLLSTLTRTGEHQVSVTDLEGRVVEEIGERESHADAATLSPDGSRLALCLFEAKGASIWIYDLERGSRSRLWADIGCGGKDAGVVWSPDGKRLVAADGNSGKILMRLADGTDEAEMLTEGGQPDISPDDRMLVFSRENDETKRDLWMLALPDGEPQPILATSAVEEQPKVSPDGSYLAYVSNESGRSEIYLRSFPEGSGRWQVSAEGGEYPRWSGVGDRLFFIQDTDRIMVADVELKATPILSNPRPLFSATTGRFGPEHGYDVAADGKSLVLVELGGGASTGADLTLITPWPDETTGR